MRVYEDIMLLAGGWLVRLKNQMGGKRVAGAKRKKKTRLYQGTNAACLGKRVLACMFTTRLWESCVCASLLHVCEDKSTHILDEKRRAALSLSLR